MKETDQLQHCMYHEVFIRRYVKVVPFVNRTRAKEVPFLWNLIQGPHGGAYLNKKLLSGLFDPT